ncbi:hypothetical protein K0M31_013122 [Melipona bicolor]|uniref:Uncharacterized protein n=1 Tax=Melipona bicolor TaxID=60889 RepID=A0AA40FIP7_9HYME|nr:hypothetical protein K0M31_013122 [Melipona bicolor]
MKEINLCVFLIICGGSLVLIKADETIRCYNFTWVAPVLRHKNCSTVKNAPCIEPFLPTDEPPSLVDYEEYWNSKKYLCSAATGDVCIKYTFSYNNDIVNTSLFCGKAIEDKIIPITSGCYEQHVDGYVLEMCACESRKGKKPCNISIKVQHNIVLVITMLLVIFWA